MSSLTHPSTTQDLPQDLRALGVFRARELSAAGLRDDQIRALVDRGELRRIGRGLYTTADYVPSEHHDLVVAHLLVPRALFCLLTALRFHGITTQSPADVWVALPPAWPTPKTRAVPLQVVHVQDSLRELGVLREEVQGRSLPITGPARTVVDCFRFRSRVGLDVALEALRQVLDEGRAGAEELWTLAQACRVKTVMRPYLEALA